MKALALAAAVAAALLQASAASASEARVAFGDLTLGNRAGADQLDARINAAADRLCRYARRPNSRISNRAECRATVRAETLRQMPEAARAEYALGRRDSISL